MNSIIGSPSSLRTLNQQRILSEVILSGSITRTELIEKTGLTNASVSRITKSLIEAGLIIESSKLAPVSGPGRRFVNITVNSKGGYVIGIKINALRQSVVILDLAKNELVRKDLNVKSLSDPDETLDLISSTTLTLLKKIRIEQHRILGVGVAITGAIDTEKGILINAPSLGWKNVAIAEILNQRLSLPVHVENLPNAINLCEHRFGITSGYKNVIAINAALGIGSSLIFDDRLVRGSTHSAGLLGQLSFTDGGQYRNKTVDDLTAGWRVLSESGYTDLINSDHRVAAKKLIKLLGQRSSSDRKTVNAITMAGKSLGRFIELYIAMTNPDAILLAGPLSRCEEYIEGITKRLEQNFQSTPSLKILTSQISGSTAAGWLAINEFFIQRPIDLSQFMPKEAA